MPLDDLFFAGFLEVLRGALLLEGLVLVETAAFVVEARLMPLAPARFFVEATVVFLPAVFFVLLLELREVADFFEATRPLRDFVAADRLPAFVVGILSP